MSCIPRHSIDSELSVYESIFSLYRKKSFIFFLKKKNSHQNSHRPLNYYLIFPIKLRYVFTPPQPQPTFLFHFNKQIKRATGLKKNLKP